MTPVEIEIQMNNMREFFERSTRPLQEEHSGYAPQEGLYTVAGQVAHAAQTIEWFFDSAFSAEWNMDWEGMDREVRELTSLSAAKEWFSRAVDKAIRVAKEHTAEEWASHFPPNPIMGEAPRNSIVSAVVDHTAHHRGALTVYQRMLGLTPLMPYMEM